MTKQKIEQMISHSEKKLAEWINIFNNVSEYTNKKETARNKIYQYKHEVINLKKGLLRLTNTNNIHPLINDIIKTTLTI